MIKKDIKFCNNCRLAYSEEFIKHREKITAATATCCGYRIGYPTP